MIDDSYNIEWDENSLKSLKKAEYNDAVDVLSIVSSLYVDLLEEERADEARELDDSFRNAVRDWLCRVEDSPQDAPPVLLSKEVNDLIVKYSKPE